MSLTLVPGLRNLASYCANGFIFFFLHRTFLSNPYQLPLLYECRKCGTESRGERFRDYESKCPTCQYDLTGNQSGTCPECGQKIPAFIARGLNRHPET